MKLNNLWKFTGYLYITYGLLILISPFVDKKEFTSISIYLIIIVIFEVWLGKKLLDKNLTGFWIACILSIFGLLELTQLSYQRLSYATILQTMRLVPIPLVFLLWWKLKKEQGLRMPNAVKFTLVILGLLQLFVPLLMRGAIR